MHTGTFHRRTCHYLVGTVGAVGGCSISRFPRYGSKKHVTDGAAADNRLERLQRACNASGCGLYHILFELVAYAYVARQRRATIFG